MLLYILTGIQGYFQFPVFGFSHPAFALITATIYLLTETLIVFYFVGSGADIKQYMTEGLRKNEKLKFTGYKCSHRKSDNKH